MQEAQTAGIDLPQKMLVWRDRRGRVFVGYNHPDYLAARHGAAEAPTLATIEAALAAISGAATGVEVEGTTRKARVFAKHPGLVFVESAHSADVTFDRLVSAIEAAPPEHSVHPRTRRQCRPGRPRPRPDEARGVRQPGPGNSADADLADHWHRPAPEVLGHRERQGHLHRLQRPVCDRPSSPRSRQRRCARCDRGCIGNLAGAAAG